MCSKVTRKSVYEHLVYMEITKPVLSLFYYSKDAPLNFCKGISLFHTNCFISDFWRAISKRFEIPKHNKHDSVAEITSCT